MCGKFAANYWNYLQYLEKFGIKIEPNENVPDDLMYEKSFTPARKDYDSKVSAVLVSDSKPIAKTVRWDMVPNWWNKPLLEKTFPTYNARGETVSEKATFKNAWNKGQRCIIWASNFSEWPDKKIVGNKAVRLEHRVSIPNQQGFAMAGLWEYTKSHNLFSCTIITTDGNSVLQDIPHTRMPVILKPEDEEKWIDSSIVSDELKDLIVPFDASLMKAEAIEK